ncbi:50S ribosome-binding GTPase [Planctomycetota bacterium]|nr:50S ribosome-binding GTPase [Planctomycetota bacterium]
MLQVQLEGSGAVLGVAVDRLSATPKKVWLKDKAGEELDEALVSFSDGAMIITCHGGLGVREAVTNVLLAEGIEEGQLSNPLARSLYQHEILSAITSVQGRAGAALALSALHRETEFEQQCVLPKAERIQLAEDARKFSRFMQPPRIQIWGPVNAGKSSLLNALCGRELARVGSQPALTRDVIEGTFEHKGFVFRVFDAPGEMSNAKGVDAAAIELAKHWQTQADLTIELIPPDSSPLDVGDWRYDSKCDRENADSSRPQISAQNAGSITALKDRLVAHFYSFDTSEMLAITPNLRQQLTE